MNQILFLSTLFLVTSSCYNLKKGDVVEREWGKPRKQFEREKYRFDNPLRGKWWATDYEVNLDSLYGVELDSAFYSFYEDRLIGIIVYLDSSNHPKMVEALEKKVGEFKDTMYVGDLISYHFGDGKIKKTLWDYDYNPNGKYGVLKVIWWHHFATWLVAQGPEYVDSLLERAKMYLLLRELKSR